MSVNKHRRIECDMIKTTRNAKKHLLELTGQKFQTCCFPGVSADINIDNVSLNKIHLNF